MSNMNIDNIKLYNKVFNDKNILIIGLGMIGGSFAKGLNEKGIIPYGYDINKATLDYAVKNNMINDSVDLYENIKIADIIILCLYPKNNIEWLKENQKYISPKTIITDVSGVKEYIIEEVKSFLRKDLTFISGHPMAGRESSGIFASDNSVFNNANYIIVPMNYDLTDKEEEGVYIRNLSAYRSYSRQSAIYNNYKKEHGLKWTDKWSARAGHSEHQTGLALDVTKKGMSTFTGFENTKEFTWISNNAHKFGFILRYPDGKNYITGYGYEPWHYRYVGVDVATYIYENDITFEEYYAYFIEYNK